MKATDLLTATPAEIKEHILLEGCLTGGPDNQIYIIHEQRDAILMNFCDRITQLETLVDRLEAVNGRSVR